MKDNLIDKIKENEDKEDVVRVEIVKEESISSQVKASKNTNIAGISKRNQREEDKDHTRRVNKKIFKMEVIAEVEVEAKEDMKKNKEKEKKGEG